ncbi:unnamed protein product [Symbiodinium natans]|uniref:Uncharacterized protein n=1 Tax=Symbiodinium natans TaxID=878477 RepID=A0A812MXG4_9DINO|nr:unnamed protein product [Symbiodinium natans]
MDDEEALVCPLCPSHPCLIDEGEQSRWYCKLCEEVKGSVQRFACPSCKHTFCEECAWADAEQEEDEEEEAEVDEAEEDWPYDGDAEYWDVGALSWAWEVGDLEYRLENGLPAGPNAYKADYDQDYPDDPKYAEDEYDQYDEYEYYGEEWCEVGPLTCDWESDDRHAVDTAGGWPDDAWPAEPELTESEKVQAATEIKRILKVPTKGGGA